MQIGGDRQHTTDQMLFGEKTPALPQQRAQTVILVMTRGAGLGKSPKGDDLTLQCNV